MTFNSNVSSTLLLTFILTYIMIFVNLKKEGKNDMDILLRRLNVDEFYAE